MILRLNRDGEIWLRELAGRARRDPRSCEIRLSTEIYDQASFGSMLAVWSRRGGSVRLVSDGRDSTLLLEANTAGSREPLAAGADTKRLVEAARLDIA